MKRIFVSMILALAFVAHKPANASSTDPLPPVDTSEYKFIGKLGPSFYWIALEENSTGDKTEKVLDVKGKTLARVSKDFLRHLKLEGTGRLKNGKLLNFADWHIKPDGTKEIRFRYCGKDAPYGYGYANRKLRAFKSVAVDPEVVPLDSILFIPQARGAVLPDGTIHDGYFEAIDVGTAIINRRIDVFTSFGDQSSVFRKNGLQHGVATDVYVVKEGEKEEDKDLFEY